MSQRNEYPASLHINGRPLNRIIIDQHYRENHPDINDNLILDLVKEIDGGTYLIEREHDGFEYFRVEPVLLESKPYRLVIVMCIHDDYLGVVNAFRVTKGK